MVSLIVFYAVINLGFYSPYKSQFNSSIWLNACYRFNELNKSVSFSNLAKDQKLDTKTGSNLKLNKSTSSGYIKADSVKNQKSIDSSKSNGFVFDSAKVANGSTGSIKDTTKVDSMAIDSTARLKYFHYQRHDVPYVKFNMGRQSDFFAQPSPALANRTINIDSTGKYVVIKQEVAGQQNKILLRIPLDQYIKMQLAHRQRKSWEDLGYAYDYTGSKEGLGDLIKNFTDFEIPLPSVGVLSIFGKPKISLKIGGAVDIHGAWRSETTQGITASRLGNTRNEPDFKQQVQINVNGTIGDKLNISADWNTERTFEYQNQLKIKYTGYEDEIIQSIEAGNVSLQTSPLVGGSDALFGVKAKFKFGPLTLTTLASQKKGQVKEVSVNGGATSQTFSVRAYQYSTNNYFVDTVYASTAPQYNFFYRYYGKPTPDIDPRYTITDIQVWKSINGLTYDRSKERYANAYIDLKPLKAGQKYPDALRADTNAIPGRLETGRFVRLEEGTDYTLHPETGYITFNTNIQNQDIIAVAYRVENNPNTKSDDDFYGEFLNSTNSDTSQKLVLKLIKPQNLQPDGDYQEAWRLLLKNIYPLGGRNIKQDGFEFKVKYEIPGQDPVSDLPTPSGNSIQLLNAFGFDSYNSSGSPPPDNVFDWQPGKTIITSTGEVIFPTLEPFGKNLPTGIPDSLAYQSIYTKTTTFAQQDKQQDRWVLTGKYSGEASSTYQLGFNVVENSVRVLLNGRELKQGVDYTVDYNIGQLTIRNDAALVPGADLKITYEQNDLFQLASKTLLGARGVFDFSKNTKLGFSILNLNQQTLSDKVRIGEEPLSNTIMGVDFQTGSDLPFLTKAIDNVISTKEMSNFSLSGEVAHMNPDPNTMKSPIPDDKGESIAYIDDFEGAKRIIPIGVSYTGWKDLSPPDDIPALSGLSYQQMMDYKGKSFWFSVIPSDVLVPQIWGNRKKVAKADQQVPVMDYVFMPDTPGTYNYNPKLQDRTKNWGGIMKVLSSTANNLVEQNVHYIEFWVHIDQAPPNADMYIDLGRISEDVIPNKKLNTEDNNPRNGLIDPGEDVGIDGLTDDQERQKFNSTKSDPSGDNYSFTTSYQHKVMDYFNINGTQGNAISTDLGKIPDTEDLNGNGNLDLANSYYRYKIPLDTNRTTNPYYAGGGDTDYHWYLFRIPLSDTTLKVGSPSFTDIEYIRMFVTGMQSQLHLRFADFNLVGNQWQKALPNDTTMKVSVINIEDNPNYYTPPGVTQQRDKSKPNEQVYQNEQSLDLIVNGLEDGQSREALKYLSRPLDVFHYKEMKLFIHGDMDTLNTNIASKSVNNYSTEFYFRFGTDSTNYYEYRQPVRPDWNDIDIVFQQLTAIKQNRDSVNVRRVIPVPGQPGHYYAVRGNPSLTAVKFLAVGVYNTTNPNNQGPVNGDVWVNELRVIGADNTPGWAYSLASSIKLADVATVNFNMSRTDPYFHKLSDRFGSRVDSRNWSLSANVNVLKLLPFDLPGSSLALNYSHTESIGKPLYLPGTDIKVDAAANLAQKALNDSTVSTKNKKTAAQIKSESQTVNVSDSWSASNIKIHIPSSSWLIRDSFNALTFGFNYNKTFSRSPTVLMNKNWVWNANMSYGINFSPENYFYPANIPIIGTIFGLLKDYRNTKVFFTPQNFSFNMTARRNRSTHVNRPQNNQSTQTLISRDFVTTRGASFSWKLTDGGFLNPTLSYNLSLNNSLAYLETDTSGTQRPEYKIWHDIFAGAFFGKPYQYQQSIDFRTNPALPSIWNLKQYFQISAGYNVSYQWRDNFTQKELGKSAGYQSKTSIGLTLRLKSLTEPLFKDEKENNNSNQGNNVIRNSSNSSIRGRGRNFGQQQKNGVKRENGKNAVNNPGQKIAVNDSTLKADSLKIAMSEKKHPIKNALLFLRTVAKTIFFDYESISVNFSSTNNVSKSGLKGEGTGFGNFWGIRYDYKNGPGRLFMMGLSSNVGPRAPNGNLQDVFSQKNELDFRTSKPLWEGAKIDLTWKTGWSINKSTTLQSDKDGNLSINNISSTGTINRSFLSIPPVFFLSALNSGIKRVHELYDPNAQNQSDNLSQAFVQGFESLPWLSKLSFLKNVTNYIPRPNWRITWDGLEKYFPFKSIAEKVSFEHAYTSNYSEGWSLTPDGTRLVQTQRIDYGFSPLVGLNFTFAKLWGGNLVSSIKYSTRSSFDLGLSTKNITETYSRDIGITAGYNKSGFELPLFGISLKNDIEFSLSYTNTQNQTIIYNMTQFKESGTPQDGSNRVTLEPRIKYTISSKVTLSIFYRRSSVQPVGASRIPPTTTNEAGLDVHISIQ